MVMYYDQSINAIYIVSCGTISLPLREQLDKFNPSKYYSFLKVLKLAQTSFLTENEIDCFKKAQVLVWTCLHVIDITET